MKYNDFIHTRVSGDGACFFHSIAAILITDGDPININGKLITEKNRGKLAIKLRQECVKWLRANLDYKIKGIERTIDQEIQSEINSGVLNKKITTVGKYLTYMSRYDSYAGQIEIYAMSNLLNKNIRVYIHNKGKFSNVGLGYEVKKKDIMNDIFLYHNLGKTKSKGSHHFDALYLRNKRDKKEKIKKKEKKSTRKSRRSTRKSRSSTRKSTRRSTRKSTRRSTRKSTRKSTRRSRKSKRSSRASRINI